MNRISTRCMRGGTLACALAIAAACSSHAARTRSRASPSAVQAAQPAESNIRRGGPAPIEVCQEPCADCSVLLESEGKVNDWSRPLRPAEQAAIARFFRDHLQSPACATDPLTLKQAAFGTGEDVSSVKHAVDGSFTAPGAEQTLVIFFAGHCGVLGAHSERYGAAFALLFENQRIVASNTSGPTAAVELRAGDLDHDGLSELVELTADYGSGTTFAQAAVWSYRTGFAQTLATFELALNSCQMPEGERYESTLLARWDKEPNTLCFLARRREVGCAKKTAAKDKVPVPRWARPGPMPAGGNWNGVYSSDRYGDLHVTLEGAIAHGSWRATQSFGELSGLIDGDLWRYSWTERNSATGPARHGRGHFRYRLTPRDPSHEIRGEWGFGHAEAGNSWSAFKLPK